MRIEIGTLFLLSDHAKFTTFQIDLSNRLSEIISESQQESSVELNIALFWQPF